MRNDVATPDNETLATLRAQARYWYRIASTLRGVQCFCGFGAIVCSLLVAATSNVLSSGTVGWLAFGAALFVSLQQAFGIGDRQNRLWRAWRMLRIAIMKYDTGVIPDIAEVIRAYERGEETLGDNKEEIK